MRVTRLKQTCNHRWFPMWAIGVDPQFHSFSSAFISRDKALKMGWGSDHATLLHLAESKELSIKLFNARNEMTKPTRRTVTFGETWASPLTAVTSFVLPYICLPRCIRIGVVESIHVPTLGRQFSCGIQTITQGAPEITCITRWLTDQNIYNRSKGDIKWHKTAGCINFLLAGMQFLNMISVASFIILLPHPKHWDADLDGFPSCQGSVHCDLPVPTGLPHGRLPGPNGNQWSIRGKVETSEPTSMTLKWKPQPLQLEIWMSLNA